MNENSIEKERFVEKLFNQINSTKTSLLSIKNFFKGMYYIQNTNLKEKLDLFLQALDEKGVLNYNEVIKICKEVIRTNLSDDTNPSGDLALEELSVFLLV